MAIASKAIQVLMVEDDEDDALLTSSALRESERDRFHVTAVTTLAAGVDHLRTRSPDVVLLDLFLPDSRGLESLTTLRTHTEQTPIVVLTGLADEAMAVEALQRGAQDYLAKGKLTGDSIRHRISYAIERQRLVSSLHAANTQLSKQNERLEELCDTAHRFVDNVSHEFRTPLTVIKEFSSLLNEGLCGELSADQAHAAQVISDRADDLTCMVNDMMDVSRLKAGILSMWRVEARLSTIIEHICPTLKRRAARSQVDLQISIPEDLPSVYCDVGKVGQIITNLVINAIKFTRQHGQVRLWACVDSPERVAVGVSDNGSGIESEKLRTICERFTQLGNDICESTKGVGLGLAIVKEFAALNLGDLSIDSVPNLGSTFSFTLPQATDNSILECYLDTQAKRNARGAIGLLQVQILGDCDTDVLDAVDRFLQSAGRPDDVAFSASPGRWLLLRVEMSESGDDAVENVCRAWAEHCRNWTLGAPPELHVTGEGRWAIDQAEGLRQRFASTRRRHEPARECLTE